MANAFEGSRVVLVQIMTKGHPKMPAWIRNHNQEVQIRPINQNTSEDVLNLKGASGKNLHARLSDNGMSLADVYFQRKTNKLGNPYTILTFLFGAEINADHHQELVNSGAPALLAFYLGKRWDDVNVRKITAADESHFFHSVLFVGDSGHGLARPRELEHDDFGLVEIWSARKNKPREDNVVA